MLSSANPSVWILERDGDGDDDDNHGGGCVWVGVTRHLRAPIGSFTWTKATRIGWRTCPAGLEVLPTHIVSRAPPGLRALGLKVRSDIGGVRQTKFHEVNCICAGFNVVGIFLPACYGSPNSNGV